jgi:hypothetical protein
MKSYCHIYGQFGQTGDRLPEELGHLLDLGLACDTGVQFGQATCHRDLLRELQRRGGLVAPNIYPADLDPACRDASWWKYPPEEDSRAVLGALADFARAKSAIPAKIDYFATSLPNLLVFEEDIQEEKKNRMRHLLSLALRPLA